MLGGAEAGRGRESDGPRGGGRPLGRSDVSGETPIMGWSGSRGLRGGYSDQGTINAKDPDKMSWGVKGTPRKPMCLERRPGGSRGPGQGRDAGLISVCRRTTEQPRGATSECVQCAAAAGVGPEAPKPRGARLPETAATMARPDRGACGAGEGRGLGLGLF